MGRKATGTVEYIEGKDGKPGHYRCRVTCVDGARPWIDLDPTPRSPQQEARAKERAAAMSERIRREKLTGEQFAIVRRKEKGEGARVTTGTEAAETCSQWWKRYHDHKEAKRVKTVKDMRARFRNYIEPHIGAKAMATITARELVPVVDALDAAVRANEIEAKTARNVWGEVTAAFGQACKLKGGLHVRDDNPAKNVEGPDRGEDKQRTILYPSEVAALLSSDRVPLYRRRVYAGAVYLAARAAELAAITAADVRFEHNAITIAKQVDRKTRKDTQTKTKSVRTFEIEPNLVPLLRALTEAPMGKSGRLLHLPPREDLAELLRKDLQRAGVTRAELFVSTEDKDRARLTFHDLRHTSLTWMGIRGDAHTAIQWRGGHEDYKTTQSYITEGARLAPFMRREVFFGPLPTSLVTPPPNAANAAKCGTVATDDTTDPDEAEHRESSGKSSAKRRKPGNRNDFRAFVATPTGLEPVLPA